MAKVAEQKSNNVTQCSVCSRPYDDPRSLPCVHNFCFQCIDEHCNKKQADGKVPCPLCTDEFPLPTTGTKGLPKNFFLDKLVQLEKLTCSDGENWPCDPCQADDEDDNEKKIATAYCIDCQEKQCESCASVHKRQKATKNHKQVQLREKLNLADIVSTSTTQTCSKHPQDELKFYSTLCKTAICFACYIELHNSHKCSNFTDMADVLRKQITEEAGKIPGGVQSSRTMLSSLERHKEPFMSTCDRVEKQIFDRFDEVSKAAERDKKKLLDELDATRQEYNKLRKKLEQRIVSLESLQKYSDELVNKGTETDVARELSTIVDRILALVNFDGFQANIDAIGRIEMKFSNSSLNTGLDSTILGNIVEISELKLIHTIPSVGCSVTGLTVINNELFVSRHNYGNIEVYDTSTFASKRSITPSGYNNFWGLASCNVNNCVYVACQSHNYILKIALSNYSVSHQWQVGGQPMGLSVDADNNLLVACYSVHKVQKYRTNGSWVQDINLPTMGITNPVHAVQNSSGNYLIGYGNNKSMQGICEVSANGTNVLRQYQPSSRQLYDEYGSPTEVLEAEWPTEVLEVVYDDYYETRRTYQPPYGHHAGNLALDTHGNVLMSNGDEQCIQRLDPSLRTATAVPFPTAACLQFPVAIFLNGQRLYVGEWTGGRVLVVDNYKFC